MKSPRVLVDSKLRVRDLTALQVRHICHGDRVAAPACVLQRRTQRPVQFEITPPAREAGSPDPNLSAHEESSGGPAAARPRSNRVGGALFEADPDRVGRDLAALALPHQH